MLPITRAFSPLLSRTYVRAGTTSCTVVSGYCHGELHARHTDHIDRFHSFRSLCKLFLCQSYRTDNSVRTYICTAVTLDTVLRLPYRDIHCDTTFLVCRRSGRCRTIYVIVECRYRKSISFLSIYLSLDILNEIDNVFSAVLVYLRCSKAFVSSVLPAFPEQLLLQPA